MTTTIITTNIQGRTQSITQNSEPRTITLSTNYYNLRFRSQPTTQLETALCIVNCFCNTELRTATVTKIKGLSIQTQLNMFVLFTVLN